MASSSSSIEVLPLSVASTIETIVMGTPTETTTTTTPGSPPSADMSGFSSELSSVRSISPIPDYPSPVSSQEPENAHRKGGDHNNQHIQLHDGHSTDGQSNDNDNNHNNNKGGGKNGRPKKRKAGEMDQREDARRIASKDKVKKKNNNNNNDNEDDADDEDADDKGKESGNTGEREGEDDNNNSNNINNDDADSPPKKKRKRPEPKPRTTEHLDLRGILAGSTRAAASTPAAAGARKKKGIRDEDQDEEEDGAEIRLSAMDQRSQVDRLLEVLKKRRKIVVIAGAGISVAAGIPDFRSSTGLFKSLKGEHKLKASGKQLFDASVYQTDSSTSSFHDMVRSLSGLVTAAKPTAFHQMLSSLGGEGRLLRLYTQNVDGIDVSLPNLATDVPLSQRGPWPRSIQLHGGLEKMVCTKCRGLSDFAPELFNGPEPPPCAACVEADRVRTNHAGKRSHGVGRLRPRIVLYNEHNPDEEAIGTVVQADLRARPDALVVVGTSMKIPGVRRIVREMAGVVRGRRDGLTVWINHDLPPPGRDLDSVWDLTVRGPADEVARLWSQSYAEQNATCSESDVERAKDRANVQVLVAGSSSGPNRDESNKESGSGPSVSRGRNNAPVPLGILTPAPSPHPKAAGGEAKVRIKLNVTPPPSQDGSGKRKSSSTKQEKHKHKPTPIKGEKKGAAGGSKKKEPAAKPQKHSSKAKKPRKPTKAKDQAGAADHRPITSTFKLTKAGARSESAVGATGSPTKKKKSQPETPSPRRQPAGPLPPQPSQSRANAHTPQKHQQQVPRSPVSGHQHHQHHQHHHHHHSHHRSSPPKLAPLFPHLLSPSKPSLFSADRKLPDPGFSLTTSGKLRRSDSVEEARLSVRRSFSASSIGSTTSSVGSSSISSIGSGLSSLGSSAVVVVGGGFVSSPPPSQTDDSRITSTNTNTPLVGSPSAYAAPEDAGCSSGGGGGVSGGNVAQASSSPLSSVFGNVTPPFVSTPSPAAIVRRNRGGPQGMRIELGGSPATTTTPSRATTITMGNTSQAGSQAGTVSPTSVPRGMSHLIS